MNSRYLLIGIIVLVVIGVGVILLGSNYGGTQVSPTPTSNEPVGAGPGNIMTSSQVKEFTVKGMLIDDPATGQKAPRFDTKEISVKKGDRVRVTFENAAGFHDFVIDEFNVRTEQLQVGQTDTVEFMADKTGSFQYYCSVNGHRVNGMVGTLIVEE